MVITGTCLAAAACSAGSRPSEFSGATMSSCAPWASMSWMSLICLGSWDCALVVSSFLTPSLAASSLMDCVSAMRKGLASFSDCEKPTTAFFRSIFVAPYVLRVQPVPGSADGVCTTWAPWPVSEEALSSPSSLAQPAARTTVAARQAAVTRRDLREVVMVVRS